MRIPRRQFVASSTGWLLGAAAGRAALGAAPPDAPGPTGAAPPLKVVPVNPATADDLQQALFRHAESGNALRLERSVTIVCPVREDVIAGEKSAHALVVPAGVQLDLNGAELHLDLRSNSYGVRLSSQSAIRNGTIRVVESRDKGSQGCWHSGISVGAAYGEGGTPDKPGHFTTVAHWTIEDMTIEQRIPACCIQLMSEACHGTIRNVRILDSDKALLGVGMDWGSVGPITTVDAEIPRMRRLWEQGEIYSTHPHDILIEGIRVGRLRRNADGNDAGVRCSACHRITIRDVQVEEAAAAVAIFGGDLGYEYARPDQRDAAHQGYVLDDIRIENALRYGLVFNGSADNVYRSRLRHGYDAVLDPVHPGIDRLTVRHAVLRGSHAPNSQGIYAVAVSQAELDDVDIAGFEIGIHVEDWVRGMRFRGCKLADNRRDKDIAGATEPPLDVVVE